VVGRIEHVVWHGAQAVEWSVCFTSFLINSDRFSEPVCLCDEKAVCFLCGETCAA
jgi:hypothetical protein